MGPCHRSSVYTCRDDPSSIAGGGGACPYLQDSPSRAQAPVNQHEAQASAHPPGDQEKGHSLALRAGTNPNGLAASTAMHPHTAHRLHPSPERLWSGYRRVKDSDKAFFWTSRFERDAIQTAWS